MGGGGQKRFTFKTGNFYITTKKYYEFRMGGGGNYQKCVKEGYHLKMFCDDKEVFEEKKK